MGKITWKSPVAFLAVAVILILTILFVVVIVIFCTINKPTANSSQSVHEYQQLVVNPSNLKKSYGIITVFKEYESESSFSFVNENGDYVLISPFGSLEYQCSGECVCDSRLVNRRISTTTSFASKGVFFLISAISSSIAIKFAEEHYDKECKKAVGSLCEDGIILAENLDCEELTSGEKLEIIEESTTTPSIEEEEETRVEYQCHGICQSEGTYKPSRSQITPEEEKKMNDFCSGSSYDKVIVFRSQSRIPPDLENKRARKYFAHGFLLPFCRSIDPYCTSKGEGCRRTKKLVGEDNLKVSDCEWEKNCKSKNCVDDPGHGCGIDDLLNEKS